MDFSLSERSREMRKRLAAFMDECVYPAEAVYDRGRATSLDPHHIPPVVEDLKVEARSRGLWNLFLPSVGGLSNVEYAPLAELMGRSPVLAAEACNCSAPDTGNMELLHRFGTAEQQRRWLDPLLEGEIRSCFAMTEPDVASSDATNIATRIERDGDDLVITGRKWWITGAADPRCRVALVLGVSDPDAEVHRRHSVVLVPLDTPGVILVRDLTVFGYHDHQGHCELRLEGARVPADSLLGSAGAGFAVAQSRLGPGRVHHCMRAIGMSERALELMARRALSRTAFGSALAAQGGVRRDIAEARIEIEQLRLLVQKTAWLLDTAGTKGARIEIAAIKAAVPRAAGRIIDRAIQVHGALGLSGDVPLAQLYAASRALRIADGPDDVHLESVARRELARYRPA
ncbi:MAG TPA: acyl-CoA dehydrogenase family protein [Streptosporangiaceae bacterium]|nr:acyl-CoA dehydrogenase family protein [Streptosporangiaceae bacterium]